MIPEDNKPPKTSTEQFKVDENENSQNKEPDPSNTGSLGAVEPSPKDSINGDKESIWNHFKRLDDKTDIYKLFNLLEKKIHQKWKNSLIKKRFGKRLKLPSKYMYL